MKTITAIAVLLAASPALADTQIDTALAGQRGAFAAQVALTTTVELKPARADYKPSPVLAQPLCKLHMRPADQPVGKPFWIDGPEAPRGTRYELCDYIGTVSVVPYLTATPTFTEVYLQGPNGSAPVTQQDEKMNKAVIAAAAITITTATVPAMASPCGCPSKPLVLTAPVPVIVKPSIPTVITPLKVVAVTPKLTVPTVTVMRDGKAVTMQDRGTNYNPLNVIAKNGVAYTAPRYYVSRDGSVTQNAININAPHNPKNIVAPK